ncbi:hypothetical protein [Burkholderia sp. BCC1988]|uniref:hypothetical protein n=2 Tax=unclassified Burkholderia TaxID=2613784 RepID=UPI002AB03AAC|nr:hypothetical protein [Burkholderia sp. BCC1988]
MRYRGRTTQAACRPAAAQRQEEMIGTRVAPCSNQDENHDRKAANMSWYCDAERELAHIRRSVGLLEQAQHAFINRSSVNDPAYWRVKLDKLRTQSERSKVLALQVDELLVRLERIQDSRCRK